MMRTSIIMIAALLMSSCVAKKEYDQLLSRKVQLEQEVDRLEKRAAECDELEKEHAALTEKYNGLREQYAQMQEEKANLQAAHNELMADYDKALEQKSAILSQSSEEKQKLANELAAKERTLDAQEQQLRQLERQLQTKEKDLDELRKNLIATEKDLMEREERINELASKLDAQQQVMQNLKDKVANALLGFDAADLNVRLEDGRVYVSMSQNLLFAKGSDKIDQKGREAITKLAEVLKANPDIEITVEGHTDTDGTAAFNWDLSVTRATTVVKVLTEAGVKPERVTASGKAFYDPVAPNDTEANMSKNRRTEIILSPKLDELFRLINN